MIHESVCMFYHYGCMTQWASGRLKPPATRVFVITVCFWLISKKISKLALLALGEGNPPVTAGFPSQRANNTESFSMGWRRHGGVSSISHKISMMVYLISISTIDPKWLLLHTAIFNLKLRYGDDTYDDMWGVFTHPCLKLHADCDFVSPCLTSLSPSYQLSIMYVT